MSFLERNYPMDQRAALEHRSALHQVDLLRQN
jgi:hypothetical protein